MDNSDRPNIKLPVWSCLRQQEVRCSRGGRNTVDLARRRDMDSSEHSGTIDDLYGVSYGNGSFVVAVGATSTIIQSDQFCAIKSVTSSTASGFYKAGASINITLNFTEPVSSAGLTINLNSGASISTGPFSNLSTYSGTYVVAAGENAAALKVSGITGSISDSGGLYRFLSGSACRL